MYSNSYIVEREKYFNDFLNKKKRELFIDIIGWIKPSKILDVGSGNGIFSLEMSNHFKSVVGLEFSERIIFAEKYLNQTSNKNIKFVKGDATNIKFKDNSFDFVYCTGVVEHILDINKAIKEIVRVSKECILIDTPTWKWECYHFLRFWLWVLTHPVYVFHRTIEKMKVENASIGSLAKTSWNKAHVNKWSVSKWRKTFQENGITIISEYTINLGMTYIILGVKVPK